MTTGRIHHLIEYLHRAVRSEEAAGASDGQLLQRYAQEGDETAFELLVWRHAGMVMGVCRSVLGDAHAAEDALQATFLLLARKATVAARFRSVGGWLHTVAYRVALRARVRRSRSAGRNQPLEDCHAAGTPNPAVEAGRREVREAIDAEVSRLPEKYRVAFVLYHLEGRSIADVAKELGRPTRTVECWLAKARSKLQASLTRRQITPASGVFAALAPRADWLPRRESIQAVLAAAKGAPGLPVSPEVAALAVEVQRTLGTSPVKLVAGILVVVIGIASITVWAMPSAEKPLPPESTNIEVIGQAGPIARPVPQPRPVLRRGLAEPFGGINAVALAPNGLTVASAGQDFRVRLWDIADGKERPNLRATSPVIGVGGDQQHAWQVNAVAFSPDGKTLASGSNDEIIRLWDVDQGVEKAALTGHGLFILALAYSPDGRMLASAAGSYDKAAAARLDPNIGYLGELKLWNLATGKEIASLKGHSQRVTCVAFSPDSKTLASGGEDGTIRFWEIPTGKERACLQAAQGWVRSIAFSPDGRTLASASDEHVVKLWDVVAQKVRAQLEGHRGGVHAVAFGADGSTLASGGWATDTGSPKSVAGEVLLWDALAARAWGPPLTVLHPISSVALNTRVNILAAASQLTGEISLWDLQR
jgi:RNA polymerase sigma factor (sigma-70 family)